MLAQLPPSTLLEEYRNMEAGKSSADRWGGDYFTKISSRIEKKRHTHHIDGKQQKFTTVYKALPA